MGNIFIRKITKAKFQETKATRNEFKGEGNLWKEQKAKSRVDISSWQRVPNVTGHAVKILDRRMGDWRVNEVISQELAKYQQLSAREGLCKIRRVEVVHGGSKGALQ